MPEGIETFPCLVDGNWREGRGDNVLLKNIILKITKVST